MLGVKYKMVLFMSFKTQSYRFSAIIIRALKSERRNYRTICTPMSSYVIVTPYNNSSYSGPNSKPNG